MQLSISSKNKLFLKQSDSGDSSDTTDSSGDSSGTGDSSDTTDITPASILPGPGGCNGGLGFNGKCLSTSTLTNFNFPTIAKAIVNKVQPYIEAKLTKNPQICVGDYPQANLSDLKQYSCSKVPVIGGVSYGVLAGSADNVQCGNQAQQVTFCTVFDKCGTVGLAINGGTAECLATYSTGVAAVLSSLSGALKYAVFAFSATKKLNLPVTVAFNDGSTISTKQLTINGNFYYGLALTFPYNAMNNAGKTLRQYVTFSAKTQVLVDLGSDSDLAVKLYNEISNVNKANSEQLLQSVINTGAQLVLVYSGKAIISLGSLTQNLFSDLTITFAANILFTTPKGSAGLRPGLYIYLDANAGAGLGQAATNFLNQFGYIFQQIGFTIPTIGSTGITLGLYINDIEVGVEFTFASNSAKCIFQFSSKKGSCSVGGKIFTAIAQAGQWVFKNGKKLFDESGQQIASFSNSAKNFSVQTFNTLKNEGKAVGNDIKNDGQKAIGTITSGGGKIVGTVGGGIKHIFHGL